MLVCNTNIENTHTANTLGALLRITAWQRNTDQSGNKPESELRVALYRIHILIQVSWDHI